MTREIDRAIDNQEHITDLSIKHIRKQSSKPEAPTTGRCLYCDKPQEDNRRWCDKYCRDDWEQERRMKGLRS